MKFIKGLLRFVLIILVIGGLGAAAYYFINNKPVPETVQNSEADVLANKILTALNFEALKNTRYLKWSFNGSTDYLYDRFLGLVNVKWDVYEVQLFLKEPGRNTAFTSGQEVQDSSEASDLIATALRKFNNDSFWLLGPYKLFDEGTTRSLAQLEDGRSGLMVEHASGGDTPGDKYLWLVDERGFPYACQMWVQILPVGGTEATWDDWVVTETGAFLPKSHKLLSFTIDMGAVEGFNSPRATQ